MVPPREDSIQARSSLQIPNTTPVTTSSSEMGPGLLAIRIGEVENMGLPIQLTTLSTQDQAHKDAQPYIVVEVDKNEIVANAKEWDLTKKKGGWSHRANL